MWEEQIPDSLPVLAVDEQDKMMEDPRPSRTTCDHDSRPKSWAVIVEPAVTSWQDHDGWNEQKYARRKPYKRNINIIFCIFGSICI